MLSVWVDLVVFSIPFTMLSLCIREARAADTRVDYTFPRGSSQSDSRWGSCTFCAAEWPRAQQSISGLITRLVYRSACPRNERFKSYSSLKIPFSIDPHVKKKVSHFSLRTRAKWSSTPNFSHWSSVRNFLHVNLWNGLSHFSDSHNVNFR